MDNTQSDALDESDDKKLVFIETTFWQNLEGMYVHNILMSTKIYSPI